MEWKRMERNGKKRNGKEWKEKECKGMKRNGKERHGKERKGKAWKGKERHGKERKGKERLRTIFRKGVYISDYQLNKSLKAFSF